MKYPAECVVHWPSGPVNVCKKHAAQLQSLSHMLGSHIAITHLEEEVECINCVNEAKEQE